MNDNVKKSKFEKFRKNYDEAIETINSILEGPESIRELANWLITTTHNPYDFLSEDYAAVFNSAEGFARLLSAIHHAVEDDGDICFLTIRGTPSIRFVDKHSNNLELKIFSKEKNLLNTIKHVEQTAARWASFGKKVEKTPYIQILDIMPNEFGTIYDEYKKQAE